MRLSAEKLAAEAESTGFRPDVLEKVAHLLGLLDTWRVSTLNGSESLSSSTAR